MKYDFDKPVDRVGTDSIKYDGRMGVFGSPDVIPLWVADMDFETPSFVTDAIRKRAGHNILGYSFRSKGYYNAIIGWLKRRHGWDVERSQILFTPGSVTAISLAINVFSEKGEGVVVQTPVYGPFLTSTESNGRRLECNRLILNDKKGRYEIDFDDLDQRLSRSRILMLCNPHNPTGRVFTREELEKMAELCIKHDVMICSDEMHADLVQRPNRHICISSLSDEVARRCVTMFAASKSFNVAGLSSTSVIIPDDDLRARFEHEVSRVHVEMGNIFGHVATEAAFTYGDGWIDELNGYLGGTIDYVMDFLRKNMPEVKCYRPESTFLMWLDFRAWGMDDQTLFDFMVREAGIGFSVGPFFGEEGSGYLRMNIASPRRVIEKAMEQLLAARQKVSKGRICR